MTSIDAALNGLDASRRVGWAKFYAERDRAEGLEDDVSKLERILGKVIVRAMIHGYVPPANPDARTFAWQQGQRAVVCHAVDSGLNLDWVLYHYCKPEDAETLRRCVIEFGAVCTLVHALANAGRPLCVIHDGTGFTIASR